MKVAFLGESPADEAALQVLVEAVLGRRVEAVPILPRVRVQGWSHVIQALPTAMRALYYGSDAQALAILLDSDDTLPHTLAHETPGGGLRDCRACQVLQLVADAHARLRTAPDRPPLRVTVGLSVPSVEAWLLCDTDPHVSEAAWSRQNGSCTYTRPTLKEALYGTRRPTLEQEKARMVERARRIAGDLDLLRRRFPIGFGLLERGLREW